MNIKVLVTLYNLNGEINFSQLKYVVEKAISEVVADDWECEVSPEAVTAKVVSVKGE